MKLAIGNDHAAVELKFEIMEHLKERGIEVVNVGTDTHDRFNYPVAGYKVAKMVAAGEVDGGVLICGTGVGISLSANKVKGIRCAVCSEPYTAKLSKQHTVGAFYRYQTVRDDDDDNEPNLHMIGLSYKFKF